MARLEAYAWPGNVRELRNEMRRLTLLGEGEVGLEDLSREVREGAAVAGDPGPDAPLEERLAALERAALEEALLLHPDNRSQAARSLGITRFAFVRKLRKHKLAGEGEEGDPEGDDAEEDGD